MDIKEQVIHESISRINKRLLEIKKILDYSPGVEICNIRIEAQKLLEENKGVEKRTTKEFIEKINILSEREKAQFKMLAKWKKSAELISEQIDLESQLSALNHELYYINNRK